MVTSTRAILGPLLLQAGLVGSLVAHRGSRRSKTTSPPASFPSQALALPRMSSGARGQGFGLGCRPSPLPNTQQCRKISCEDIFGAYCNDSPMFASAARGARWLSPRGVTQCARHRAAPCLLHLPRCHRAVCKHDDSSLQEDLLHGVDSGSAASTLLPPRLPPKIPCPALLGCRRRPSPPVLTQPIPSLGFLCRCPPDGAPGALLRWCCFRARGPRNKARLELLGPNGARSTPSSSGVSSSPLSPANNHQHGLFTPRSGKGNGSAPQLSRTRGKC